ncbi:hypothetical protein GGD54_005631 [Rhizobium tropici]|uniref:Uncharacterized protein n=2 Tax=Rhizobium TaxID=379 RepID=A0A1C3XAX8_9HYPH|nr:hypothetical protein [Rhizobium tropici]MBB6305353.1 hypothetical protein [Rhizobium leucaenae]MBB6488213.1 hypothetical protein [Rhizobium lusitanum]MBB5596235.1 hypothetical protein [Rhizobium tropici]MBB6495188.1 hypothetical protein [Rhizobium tropici]
MLLAITSHSTHVWQRFVVPFRPKREGISGITDWATFAAETLGPELDVPARRSAAVPRARQAVNGSRSLGLVRYATIDRYATPGGLIDYVEQENIFSFGTHIAAKHLQTRHGPTVPHGDVEMLAPNYLPGPMPGHPRAEGSRSRRRNRPCSPRNIERWPRRRIRLYLGGRDERTSKPSSSS